MFTHSELRTFIDDLLKSRTDCVLYDLELPRGGKGEFTVFISKASGAHGADGITHEDCAEVSRLLDESQELDYLRTSASLVVSSPGVNRRLKRREHFDGALGERVKLNVERQPGRSEVLTGKLLSFNEDVLEIEQQAAGDKKKQGSEVWQERIPYAAVKKAQIDFIF